jgi:DNA-binding LacI/PurR family transcriptional regulator
MTTPATGNQMPPMTQLGCIAAYQMGMSIAEIARMAGCAYTTVKGIVNNPDLVAKYTNHELTNKLKKQFPDRIFAKAHAMLDNINPDAANLSEAQKATIFGILFDKYRLSTGQATQIVDYNELTGKVHDIDAQITELEDKLQLDAGKDSTQQQIEEKK